jgi:protein gp37
MSDLFLEDFSDEYIAAVFGVMAAAPRHRFLVLTKRAERMRRWFEWVADTDEPIELTVQGFLEDVTGNVYPTTGYRWFTNDRPLSNVFLGVSVENQATADERIPHLLATPAAVRFVSYEPALGPVSFFENGGDGRLVGPAVRHAGGKCGYIPGEPDDYWEEHEPGIDWLIVGGESGPGARAFDVAWARSAIEQCRGVEVPVFVKQLGARPTFASGREAGKPPVPMAAFVGALSRSTYFRNRKGGDPSEWPEDLRVREWPDR